MKKNKIIYLTLLILVGVIFTKNYLQIDKTYINKKITTLTYNENNITNLSTPEELLWKENSTATATWTKVTNANYYQVYVYVYNEGNLIGSTKTGTSDNEIDLQHEINKFTQNLDYEKVQVKFKVVAIYIDLNSDNTVESNESSLSDVKEYLINIAIPLKTPINLNFSNTYVGTWDYDKNTYYFTIEFKFTKPDGKIEYVSSIVYKAVPNSEENPFTYNLETYLENAYKTSELTNTNVKASFRIKSNVSPEKSKNYKNSSWSEWSNEIDYYNNDQIIKFLSPTNLNLENTLIGSWDFDENVDYYWIKFKFTKSDGTTMQYDSPTYIFSTRTNKDNNEIFLANLSNFLIDAYRRKGLLGSNVKVSFSVKSDIAAGSTKNYKESDWSEWSNEIDYYNDVELIELLPPTQLNLSETFEGTWTFDENAYYYNVRFKFIKSDGTQEIVSPLNSNFLSTGSEELFTKSIKTYMEESYNTKSLSPEPVLVSFSVSSRVLNENEEYTNSKYSEWSNQVIYNPNNYPLVEKITLAPKHAVVAVGKTLYIGKTITPEDGYYSKIKWTSDDTNIVKINTDGLITGKKVGTTNIKASILNVEESALVSVYEINSNIENADSSQALIDETTSIIDEIMINKNTNNTDITDINQAVEKIENGAKEGNAFHIDLNTLEKSESEYANIKELIKEKYNDAEIAVGYDITLELYHQNKTGEKEHIANITEVENNIDFKIKIPENIPPVENTKKREYQLIKYHNNEIEKIEMTDNEDGTISASSNEFSDFILLYEDTDILPTQINVYNLHTQVYVGYEMEANVVVLPANASNKNYTVTSSDTSVIVVENNIVKPVGPGTAKVTFTTVEGNISSSITITVTAPLKSISINDGSSIIMNRGETLKLNVTYDPENTTDDKTVVWSSNSPETAIVEDGVVTALKLGTVIITAKVGGKTASCYVYIRQPLESISLNKTEGELNVGQVELLEVTLNPSSTTEAKVVTWTTSDENVATVENGIITAVGPGKTTITAQVKDKTATYELTVKNPLIKITINKTTDTLNVGETDTLTITYNPDNTTDDKTITWESSNPKVATIENGVVTAISPGITTIYAKVGEKKAYYILNVNGIELINISLNKTKGTLKLGETETLIVTYNPTNTTVNRDVTWTSSDESIATVKDGVITTKNVGKVTITARVGTKTAAYELTINNPLESISLNKTEGTLNIGETETLTVTYNPTNTTDNKDVIWTTSDESVATVKDGVVTGVNKGTATITATVGTKVATYKVEIKDIPLISISLNKSEGTLNIGETETLTVTYNPTNTTDNKAVIWTTSDESVATVQNGVVTGITKGTATITATVGTKVATYKVEIKDIPLISINLNKSEGTLNIGETETLTVTYNPTNTTDNKDVIWTSSDERVATVQNGLVTGITKGTATITATVGTKTATYRVEIKDELTLYKITTQKGYKVLNNFVHGFNIGDTVNAIKTKLGNNISINSAYSIIGTGTEISYKNEKYTIVIYGDITGDGIINSADLLKMRQHLLGTINLSGSYKQAASIVNKTTINSADLLRLRQHLLGTNLINQ